MRKILILLTIASSLLFAENETVNIEDEKTFIKIVFEKFDNVENKYNLNVKALIIINEKGELDYKIIKESDIPKFNDDVIIILEEKRKTKFPILKNKKTKFEMDFTAENINEKPKLKNIKEF